MEDRNPNLAELTAKVDFQLRTIDNELAAAEKEVYDDIYALIKDVAERNFAFQMVLSSLEKAYRDKGEQNGNGRHISLFLIAEFTSGKYDFQKKLPDLNEYKEKLLNARKGALEKSKQFMQELKTLIATL